MRSRPGRCFPGRWPGCPCVRLGVSGPSHAGFSSLQAGRVGTWEGDPGLRGTFPFLPRRQAPGGPGRGGRCGAVAEIEGFPWGGVPLRTVGHAERASSALRGGGNLCPDGTQCRLRGWDRHPHAGRLGDQCTSVPAPVPGERRASEGRSRVSFGPEVRHLGKERGTGMGVLGLSGNPLPLPAPDPDPDPSGAPRAPRGQAV